MNYETKIDAETWSFIHKTGEYYPPETLTYTVAQQREIYDRMCRVFFQGYPKGVNASDHLIGTIPTRHYKSSHSPATVMYFHGGGFVVGGLDSHDDVCAEICDRTGLEVVSVDYRMAPENLHPAMHEDCLTATKHIIANTDAPILLAVDSAGANLAATVAAGATKVAVTPSARRPDGVAPDDLRGDAGQLPLLPAGWWAGRARRTVAKAAGVRRAEGAWRGAAAV